MFGEASAIPIGSEYLYTMLEFMVWFLVPETKEADSLRNSMSVMMMH